MRLLTPVGPGGVAVVQVVAAAERTALLSCLTNRAGRPVHSSTGAPPRWCQLGWDGVVRDEVLLVDRGHRGLELHLHGSPALLDALVARFGALQVTRPSPAERLLQQALSAEQLDLALEQIGCDFDAFLASLPRLPAPERRRQAAAALARSDVAMALAQPHPVALVGRQNAGKSTLLNRLLFRERALAGELPGLTRDPVREVTCLDGHPYEFIDTAGEGPAADAADVRAQQLARAARVGRDQLLVIDASTGPTPVDRRLWTSRTVVVANKADLVAAPWPGDFPCDLRLSCGAAATAGPVRQAIAALLRARRGLPPAAAVGGPAALDDDQLRALRAVAGATATDPA